MSLRLDYCWLPCRPPPLGGGVGLIVPARGNIAMMYAAELGHTALDATSNTAEHGPLVPSLIRGFDRADCTVANLFDEASRGVRAATDNSQRPWLEANAPPGEISCRPASREEKGVALVIGNNEYKGHGQLRNAVADARLMAETLRNAGFEVIEVYDATRDSFKVSWDAFQNKMRGASVVAMYFSGHGAELEAKKMIIMVEEKTEEAVNDLISLHQHGIRMDEVVASIKHTATSAYILLDTEFLPADYKR